MKIHVQTQTQIQTSGVDKVKNRHYQNQKGVMQQALTQLTTDRSIGHRPETSIIPDHTIGSKINAGQVPFYPDLLIKLPPRLPDINMYHNRRTTLD